MSFPVVIILQTHIKKEEKKITKASMLWLVARHTLFSRSLFPKQKLQVHKKKVLIIDFVFPENWRVCVCERLNRNVHINTSFFHKQHICTHIHKFLHLLLCVCACVHKTSRQS